MKKPIALFPTGAECLEHLRDSLSPEQLDEITHISLPSVPAHVNVVEQLLRSMEGEVLIIYGKAALEDLIEAVERTDKAIWYCQLTFQLGAFDRQWYIVEGWVHGSSEEYKAAAFKHNEGFNMKQMGYG